VLGLTKEKEDAITGSAKSMNCRFRLSE